MPCLASLLVNCSRDLWKWSGFNCRPCLGRIRSKAHVMHGRWKHAASEFPEEEEKKTRGSGLLSRSQCGANWADNPFSGLKFGAVWQTKSRTVGCGFFRVITSDFVCRQHVGYERGFHLSACCCWEVQYRMWVCRSCAFMLG